MKIRIVTPAPPRSRAGNRITALRWARLLRDLGHRTSISQTYRGEACDLLAALHARRSHASIRRFRRLHPRAPLVVGLTGTDLYGDLRTSRPARESLEMATRVVLLQPAGLDELPPAMRRKARVIYQSAVAPRVRPKRLARVFEVCVLGHLRPVKDPFRTALAARRLPDDSRIGVVHIGRALSDAMQRRAESLTASIPRYRWLGELTQAAALRRLGRCRLLVLSSKSEGGANVISEALAADVPILSSRIAGSIGLLGADYPGYFPVGDTAALTELLDRAETDRSFYGVLRSACRGRRALVTPREELSRWRALIAELS